MKKLFMFVSLLTASFLFSSCNVTIASSSQGESGIIENTASSTSTESKAETSIEESSNVLPSSDSTKESTTEISVQTSESEFSTEEAMESVTYIYNDVEVNEEDQKGIISGIVTCKGNPVSSVTITYGDKKAYSMVDGTFRLRSVDLKDGKVTFSKSGYYDFRTKLNVSEITSRNVVVNCELTSIAMVTGLVKDTWGMALSNATITVEGTGISVKSSSNGEYILTGLVESDFFVVASKDGYQSVRRLVREEWFSDGVASSIDFACHKLGKLSGVVSDSSSGSPLANVKVVCGSDVCYSDASGKYELTNIYPENSAKHENKGFEVEYSCSGYTTVVETIDFYASANYEVTKNVSLKKS
jgi:hypothetical protein